MPLAMDRMEESSVIVVQYFVSSCQPVSYQVDSCALASAVRIWQLLRAARQRPVAPACQGMPALQKQCSLGDWINAGTGQPSTPLAGWDWDVNRTAIHGRTVAASISSKSAVTCCLPHQHASSTHSSANVLLNTPARPEPAPTYSRG